jgi:hypothetical protein
MQTKPLSLVLVPRLLRGLIVLNLVYGSLIALLLAASLVAGEWVMDALGVAGAATGGRDAANVLGMRMIMVLGVASAGVAHVALARLLEIIGTVQGGDPFSGENARRLRQIARAVLGLEVLRLGVLLAARVAPLRMEMDVSGSLTRWLAVLLLFVLAWVFEQGARMREELEGTV